MKGRFISFEGIDACGKDTQMDLFTQVLDSRNFKYWKTAEPTDGIIGKFIREECLSGKTKIEKSVLDQLFVADRLEHINATNGLKYHLTDGEAVVCGRYALSGIVYMAYNLYTSAHFDIDKRVIAVKKAIEYNRVITESLVPDDVIYIKIDPEVAIERIKSRKGPEEIYDKLDTLKILDDLYKIAINMIKNEWFETTIIEIDGNQEVSKVHDDILNQLHLKEDSYAGIQRRF